MLFFQCYLVLIVNITVVGMSWLMADQLVWKGYVQACKHPNLFWRATNTINTHSATFNTGSAACCAAAPVLMTQDLEEEYTSFFDNFASERYLPNVEFIDPLTSFTGFQKYKNNVDMLGGRSALGNILFKVREFQNIEPYFQGTRCSKNVTNQVLLSRVHERRKTGFSTKKARLRYTVIEKRY